MNKLKVALLLGASLVMSVAAQAQTFRYWYINQITNPGFESSTFSPWDNSYSYYETDEYHQVPFGAVVKDSHSGSKGFDFNVGEGSYNQLWVGDLRQTLASPTNSNSVVEASVWAQAGSQYLHVIVHYSDNTASSAYTFIDSSSATPGSNGFIKWNFTSTLTPNKTITGIEFWASSGEGDDIVIDDVTLTTPFYIIFPFP